VDRAKQVVWVNQVARANGIVRVTQEDGVNQVVWSCLG
jgi:hypothetical protein